MSKLDCCEAICKTTSCKSIIGALIGIILFWLLGTKNVLAAEPKFAITADINYKISDSGITTVTQEYKSTNLTSENVLSEFSTRIGLKDINTLKAYDQNGALSYSATNIEGGKSINLSFSKPTLGINKEYSWTLIYSSSEIAKRDGRFWRINISRPAEFNELKDFKIK
ncbi:hypothetical protein HY310_01950, partial [Candidatus Microgenomates bacterium]|nr:hypothetical protein [Candidatus Microgenomates bacterium]